MSNQASTPPTLPADVPRLLYLIRLLWLCFFPVFTVLAGVAFLLTVEQAREAMLSLDSGSFAQTQVLSLLAALLFWVFLAWYTCRLLLDRRFVPDTLGNCTHPGFSLGLQKWLPRLLILGGGLPIAAFFIKRSELRMVGVALAALTLAFFAFAVLRRTLLLKLGIESRLARWLVLDGRRSAIQNFAKVDALPQLSIAVLGVCLLLSWALMAVIVLQDEYAARWLGSAALVLFALGAWTLFGGIVLTYLPKTRGWLVLTWLPLPLWLGFSALNENHPVASGGDKAAINAPRPAADERFTAWLKARPEPDSANKAPVILVAVAGGASRAAYWGSTALALLETNPVHGRSSGFADRVFAISGTSGGALAAASFVAALDARTHAARPNSCDLPTLTRDFTGRDHLATAVAYMLFPDLVQRFLPVAIDRLDRSRALEQVWTRDWQDAVRNICAPNGAIDNPFSAPFTALQARATAEHPLPLLALNSTALGRGQRIYQADYRLPSGGGIDLLGDDPTLAVSQLTLAQAVHNSARFPYISPAGVVKNPQGKVWDRLGDGGYIEASGTLALLDLLGELRAQGLLEGVPLRLVLLGNAPSKLSDWLCVADDKVTGKETGKNNPEPHDQRRALPHPMAQAELLAPAVGMLETNSARALTSTLELIKQVGGCQHVAELRLPYRADLAAPSMNWMLNAASRKQIDEALGGLALPSDPEAEAAQQQLQQQMGLARAWLTKPPLAKP